MPGFDPGLAQQYQADAIASAFLQSINAPDTPSMRTAVKAWIRAESGSSVRAGNPWNISYPAAQEIARRGGPAPSGSWTSSSGQKFAAYSSATVGATAAGKLLTGAGTDWRHYDKIVSAAREGSPIDFLNALASSAWDAGRYGTNNGGPNHLIPIYVGLGGKATDAPGWIAVLNKKPGDTFEATDVPKVMDWLQAHGVVNSGSIQSIAVSDNLNTLVGLKIGSPEFDAKLAAQANIAGQGGPIGKGATDAAGTAIAALGLGGFVVGHLLAVLALIAAAALVGFGVLSMSKSTAHLPGPVGAVASTAG